ncbi:MAG: hypothetical protein KC414_11845, partial [Romboutsia sp.]|nr:hypothetical protein [Romboutsia sp.]
IFYDYFNILLEYLENNDEITVEQEIALTSGAEKVWQYFFKLEKSMDIPFVLGTLYYNLEVPKKAIEFHLISLKQFGRQTEALYNLALAYQLDDDNENALAITDEILTIEPDYKPARDLTKELLSCRNEQVEAVRS